MSTSQERSLQGWAPEPGKDVTLAQVIDMAFDYRGNVTVVKADGTEVVGYVFNRNSGVAEPYIQMFGESGDGPFRLLYSEIRNIKFTGRDMAAGNSWAAWLKRKGEAATGIGASEDESSSSGPQV
ncbi:MAG: hypothetical protein HY684_06155 [Chloroflexi bacterium]|nr:hypothetical protein [Chloroflexota bacterium]